jgi:23S rRNA (uracil-5-)-methyltransferase RumA
LILLTIKRLGINGEGIGYYKRLAVFVEGAIPGEVIEVKITDIQEKYAYGEISKIKTKSPDRVTPRSSKLMKSGLTLQHIKYEKQLELKKESIIESFERYYNGNVAKIKFHNTFGMDYPWEYRNKTGLPVRHDGDKVVVGMYEHNTNRLIYMDEYLVENKLVQKALKDILDYLTKAEINIYNPRFQQGNLRYIIIRGFEETGEVQVTFVLMEEEPRILNIFKQIIKLDNIKSVNYTINNDPKSIEMITGKVINLVGSKKIKGKLGKLDFEISPESFFQLNTKQSVVLYDQVVRAAGIKGYEKVLDLYCGIGSIGLYLADKVNEVRGIDISEENIKNARDFAAKNNINNASFYYGNILPHLNKFEKEGFVPDILIVDPPRKGMDLNLLNYLQKAKVRKIVYVSCNPATLTKNVNHLQKAYDTKFVIPVDMFPFTPHIECVVLLERR